MTKLDYLYKAKNFLKRIVQSRRWLLIHDKSPKRDKSFYTEIKNIEYALGRIKTSAQMQHYLSIKEGTLRMMIPSNKKVWFDELGDLLNFNS